jgi:MAF protein
MPRLVLATTSPYRRALMERLGLPFACVAPRYEETPDVASSPEALVLEHALGKARSVAAEHADALIIGSDQVAVLGERILGKPRTPDRAVAQLTGMRGREHRLLTAVVVLDAATDRVGSHVEVSTIRMRDLGDEEIREYVRREAPIDCAGSYRSEGLGIALFEHLRGDDPTAVVGMPLIGLCRLLRQFGVSPLGGSS